MEKRTASTLRPVCGNFLLEHSLNTIPTGSGNEYPLGSPTDSEGKFRTSVQKAPSKACTAGADGPPCLSFPWPVPILGPIPEAFVQLAAQHSRSPSIAGEGADGTCGHACSSNGDCGSDCMCAVPSATEAQTLGVDPVAPPALCLTVASVFGRGLQSLGHGECLCNSTYVAPACHHSRDDIVHVLDSM